MPKYNPEALELFNKRNMCNGMDHGTTEFQSANVLRNSIKQLNLESGTERFKSDKKGGHYAESTAIPSCFNKK